MISRDVKITNSIGLHARPATFFVQKANCFRSVIKVEKDDRIVSAKSLLGILSLGIAKGSSIVISAEGPDEEAAVDALEALINGGLDELTKM